ncbi:MAG: hypothetical protein XE11_1977 [Methanomicrobiales archaeon 53_19]|jgi:hypothetical protein|uniref:DUF4013 domain-containing protein n=1 Tax=Methanocalculus sp. TaxID=2004547 RepID=UPI000748C006|nr:DUF4013 domain-containing protein [Methanocalculus sp.]KUL01883.1 MAG: hypothetical protein XE11_1977 [Methanomicrobiales archaeon 53_19]HIJ07077.1 DUF4013 domain-containing protein [Methanocalculus sp.]
MEAVDTANGSVPDINIYSVPDTSLQSSQGKTPAPEVETRGKLFVDGLKLNIVTLIYMIPVIIILIIFGAATLPFVLTGAAIGRYDWSCTGSGNHLRQWGA